MTSLLRWFGQAFLTHIEDGSFVKLSDNSGRAGSCDRFLPSAVPVSGPSYHGPVTCIRSSLNGPELANMEYYIYSYIVLHASMLANYLKIGNLRVTSFRVTINTRPVDGLRLGKIRFWHILKDKEKQRLWRRIRWDSEKGVRKLYIWRKLTNKRWGKKQGARKA